MPPQETLKHSKVGVTQSLVGSLGPGVHKVLFEPSKCLWRVWGLILNMILPLLPSCWGFSFTLGCGVSFFAGIQYSPFNGCSAAGCNFGVLAGEDEHVSFNSAILEACFDYFSFGYCGLESGIMITFSMFFFLKIVLAMQDLLCFHTNFRIYLF